MPQRQVPVLEYKPGMEDTARRWDAYFAGEIIDRPIVCVTAPKETQRPIPGTNYRDRAFGDFDELIDRAIAGAENTYFCGESIPSFWMSFGPDEVAVFCGAELEWDDASGDTNWSKPCVENWEDAFPIRINEENPLWQRMLAFYRRASERLAGKILLSMPDLHTNMDLLAAMRGPERLCMDLLDQPEMIDRAMVEARAVFPVLWDAVRKAGRFDETGYRDASTPLQCDFSCMISPEMCRRWVIPALEEEAEIVQRAMYHWDGPDAIKHIDDLAATKGLHTFAYVPSPGLSHMDHIDLFKEVQARGKAVVVWGSPDQIKAIHRELKPEKAMYSTGTYSLKEAEDLLEWFVRNT